ncbi:MAG: hypothetical protein H0T79_01145, partial [Deltaproteobacteria bacterium]|nr:hypothetical protein [Deltaproteobacteria bacterium]
MLSTQSGGVIAPVPLARVDVEAIRVVHERTFAAMVEHHPAFPVIVAQLRQPDPKDERRRLMANSLRLSESMAPDAYRIAHHAQRI